MNIFREAFSSKISKKQCADSGAAATLIILLISLFLKDLLFVKIAVLLLVIAMVTPLFYYPFAIFWFGLAHILGTFISKILLSIIFILLVIPVGVIRKIAGKDSLKLKQFKLNTSSVMHTRDKWFTKEDILNPY